MWGLFLWKNRKEKYIKLEDESIRKNIGMHIVTVTKIGTMIETHDYNIESNLCFIDYFFNYH